MIRLSPLVPVLLLAGCGHSAPTRFLTIDAVPPPATVAPVASPPLRVTAVHVPADMDRLAFVTQPGPGRVVVHDFDRWAAGPGALAREALVRDLVLRLPAGGVLPLDAGPTPTSWRADVDILALGAGPNGSHLEAVLTLARDEASGRGVGSGRAKGGEAPIRLTLRLADPQPVDPGDARALPVATAQAYGRLLAQVADRIVAATARLDASR